MSLVINTNVNSINAQRLLINNNMQMSKTLSRLSSGFRINRAADDAAGLAISNDMRAQLRGSQKAITNTQDGIAVLNVVDGSIQQISENLQRMRELSKQAGNDTYDVAKRANIKAELDQLKTEISRIANSTQFNGRVLLGATVIGSYRIQVGAGNNNSATGTDTIRIDSAFGNMTASTGGLLLGTTNVSTSTFANALASRIDAAMTTIANRLATVGALTNRFETTIKNLNIYIENLAGAESRIRNTDVAQETAELTRLQILQQSTLSMIGIANQQPQAALTLIRGGQ